MSDKPHAITNKGEVIALTKYKASSYPNSSFTGCMFVDINDDCTIMLNVADEDIHSVCGEHVTYVWERVTPN